MDSSANSILNKCKILRCSTLLFIFMLFFVLNFLSPPQNDDWIAPMLYEYDIAGETSFIDRVIASYKLWNGRFGELIFIGFISKLPAHLFDIINAVVGSLSILMFFVFLFARIPRDRFDFALLLLLILQSMILIPFEEMFLWGAGSLNYLWAWVFVLFAIIPFRIFYQQTYERYNAFKTQNPDSPNLTKIDLSRIIEVLQSSKLAVFGFFVINVIAGMSNETFSIIVIFVHIVLIICANRLKISLPLWYKIGVIGFIIGFLVLFLSPGQNRRAEFDHIYGEFLTISQFFALSVIEKCARAIKILQIGAGKTPIFFLLFCFGVLYFNAFNSIWRSKIANIAIFICASAILLIFSLEFPLISFMLIFAGFIYSAWKQKDVVLWICSALFLLWFISLLSTIQFTELPARARISSIIILITIVSILAYYKLHYKIANGIFAIISLVYFCYCVGSYIDFYVKYNAFEDYIAESKKNYQGEEVLLEAVINNKNTKYYGYPIDIIYPKEKWTFSYPYFSRWWSLGDTVDSGPNKSWAWHFKVKSILVK